MIIMIMFLDTERKSVIVIIMAWHDNDAIGYLIKLIKTDRYTMRGDLLHFIYIKELEVSRYYFNKAPLALF